MRCILGLGNPGREYAETRHNLGFRVVDLLAQRHRIRLRARFYSRWGRGTIAGQPVVLAQPLTFMNASGSAARRLLERFSLAPSDLLVIYDDLDLELGRLRLRRRGSAGTHKGMRSVVECLGTEDFPRLRLGIGPLPPGADAVAFVLSPFRGEEQPRVEEMLARAAESVEFWLQEGIEAAMNRYNT
jgi:PTH1 family peptidyl-tRNA hydrolase